MFGPVAARLNACHSLKRSGSRASTVKWWQKVVLLLFLTALSTAAQEKIPTFKIGALSSLVWDANLPQSDTSSTLWDPLTGNEIHRLSYGGIEVSSRVGYERVSPSMAGTLLSYSTTIANNTEAELSVRYGGASVDGHVALPLWIAPTLKSSNKRDRDKIWELSKMNCFKTGFASSERFFSYPTSTRVFMVRPKTAITISFVTKDPNRLGILCSIDGCHVLGSVRYYVTVNRTDYVFVWPGRSVVYCGE